MKSMTAKALIPCIAIALACGDSRNEKMAELLVQQKGVEAKIDSIDQVIKHEEMQISMSQPDTMPIDFNSEKYKAEEEAHTKKWSERNALHQSLKAELKNLNFSIDSLSKMK